MLVSAPVSDSLHLLSVETSPPQGTPGARRFPTLAARAATRQDAFAIS